MADTDRASTPFSPILMLMYTVPGVSIIDFLAISPPILEQDRHYFRSFPDLLRIFSEFSPISPPLFRANVAFFDRKNGAYVKIWAIFTGGAARFSPPGTHDREFSPLIGYTLFPIAADHPCAGIKRPRSAASRRG